MKNLQFCMNAVTLITSSRVCIWLVGGSQQYVYVFEVEIPQRNAIKPSKAYFVLQFCIFVLHNFNCCQGKPGIVVLQFPRKMQFCAKATLEELSTRNNLMQILLLFSSFEVSIGKALKNQKNPSFVSSISKKIESVTT